MKKYSLLLLAAGLSSASAMAQSNVTVYGIVDTSLRYVSNDNAAGNSNFRMDNGALSNSRWGLKGTEDLGNGLKAIFRLENGFSSDTGGMSDGSRMFNRHAYVGLANDYGQFTAGRQTTPLFDLMADHFDPLTVGNYDLNSWMPAGATLVRNSNMLKYQGSFGNLSTSISYSPGEQAGSLRRGRQAGATLRYSSGPFAIGGGVQQTVSAVYDGWKDTAYNLSASYAFDGAKLFGGYYRINDSTGTTTAVFGAANSLAAYSGGVAGIERRDNGFFIGANFQASPLWTLTGAAYYDRSSNVAIGSSGNVGDGKRYTLVAVAEYALSKRTQVYGTIDYNKASDAATAELAGKNNVTGAGIGIRHSF
ncbi:porin [Herbaspirillum sp. RTI4]|uniref:porin n=1 Tax=Herbaspirillum sp. RTI4 TaxID=3048640 RepID=UPI002AB37C78|nr:porin [Herbaspirillum sp. RTI4]MDY7578466.1 porin [Herbaspirillum sp. RTI4]MEA9981505.1 porin [Herbaspirillum sp. RTI4]